MKKFATFINLKTNMQVKLEVASTFFSKFCGLMFRKSLAPGDGLILSESSESIINSSIHMFFMRFDITVVWLNREFTVVDKCIARKWHPAYFSKTPALHVLELHNSQLDNFSIGDKLIIIDEK
jgi:uncharacterized membrane protein (UPF0127 family)